jgi:putative ABC transport system permease protein
MTALWQDLRFSLRVLRKSPGFTAVAILTLALGIRATSAIWSVVDSVLLHLFPYKNADRLAVPSMVGSDGISIASWPVPVFLAFKEQNHTFEDMIGRAYLDVRYKAGGRTEQFQGMWITPNTFEFLGIQPLLGRPITPEDAKPGSAPVFAMSYALWTKLFNRDAGVLGKALTLNGHTENPCGDHAAAVSARRWRRLDATGCRKEQRHYRVWDSAERSARRGASQVRSEPADRVRGLAGHCETV